MTQPLIIDVKKSVTSTINVYVDTTLVNETDLSQYKITFNAKKSLYQDNLDISVNSVDEEDQFNIVSDSMIQVTLLPSNMDLPNGTYYWEVIFEHLTDADVKFRSPYDGYGTLNLIPILST